MDDYTTDKPLTFLVFFFISCIENIGMPKQSERKHFTKAMLQSKKTSDGVKPDLPCKKRKGKPTGTLPGKKMPAGMEQNYRDVPDYALKNKVSF